MGIPLGGGGVCSEELSPKNKRARDKKGRGVEEVRLEGDDRGEMEEEEKREREMEGGRSQKGREGGKNLELLPQSFMCLLLLASQSTTFFFFLAGVAGRGGTAAQSHWGSPTKIFFPLALALGYPSTPPSLPPSQCSTQAYRVYQL
jgi:hypothetical protein